MLDEIFEGKGLEINTYKTLDTYFALCGGGGFGKSLQEIFDPHPPPITRDMKRSFSRETRNEIYATFGSRI